ncbi:hypothetical protein O3M35_004575 [Rhynocoris fuscipes]|uniref:Uncharacterized protein n=1 Tax=Rhynocoris fuscipes TaxID=488301 RepID=A0AAW1CL66_9HEMI
MEKANKALRRSGIRLRSVKSGHLALKLIISDWKESKNAYKSFISNQETAWSDIVKWAASEHNRGLREVLDHVVQLQALWTDVQTQFLTALKKIHHQFEAILESEMQLDKSRALLNTYEQKEMKLSKEFRKASSKSSVDDLKQIEEKLAEVKVSIQSAQMEVASNTTENESVKMLLMKEGLLNLSNQFIELADKTAIIFKAQRVVAGTLPDAQTNVQDIKFNGADTCTKVVAQAKKDLNVYKSISACQANVPPAPPPYFPPSPNHDASFSSAYFENPPRYYNVTNDMTTISQPSASNYCHDTSNPGPSTHFYDLPPPNNYANLQEQLNNLQLNQ